jgi:hypothetical protein
VIKLTEQVETKTLEEDEDVLFKMCVDFHLFHLDLQSVLNAAILIGVQSSSDSIVGLPSGKNVELAMFACCPIRKQRKYDSSCDATRL